MTQLRVRDIMTTQVITLSAENTLKDAVIKFAIDTISGAPVIDNNYRLIGIISENDVLETILKLEKKYDLGDKHLLDFRMDDNVEDSDVKAAIKEFSETKVGHIMAKTLMTTSPDSPIIEVLKAMLSKDVNRLPVLEKGVLVGIVTRSDITFAMYKKKKR